MTGEFVKKVIDFRPDLLPAGKSAPKSANDSHQLKTSVDGNAKILRVFSNPIHEQGFDIGFKSSQQWIPLGNDVPIFKIQGRLHNTAGARILSKHLPGCAAVNEESQVDRYQQTFPFVIVHREIVETIYVSRNAAVSLTRVAAEQNGTSFAGTCDPACSQLQKMRVFGSNGFRAEFAYLCTLARFADKLLQSRERTSPGISDGNSHGDRVMEVANGASADR